MTTPSRENHPPPKLDAIEWEKFYREHHQKVLSLLIGVLKDHSLAQEASQVAFIKAFEKIHEVKTSARKAWLYRVAINEAWLIRRRQQTEQKHLERVAETNPSETGFDSTTDLSEQERIYELKQAIEQLPPDQKRVVLLRMRDDKTFADIASDLNVPLGTVLTRMRLAIDKLRKLLQAEVK